MGVRLGSFFINVYDKVKHPKWVIAFFVGNKREIEIEKAQEKSRAIYL